MVLNAILPRSWAPAALGSVPELTSVDLRLEEVGRVAAGCLLAALAGEEPRGVRQVAARLVVRRSSGGDAAGQAVPEASQARPGGPVALGGASPIIAVIFPLRKSRRDSAESYHIPR